MGTGYVRQSAADIVTGAVVEAAPINAELNQLRDAFHETSGHSHDATAGEGPLISLTTSISGVLPVANGGFAGIHKVNGTTAPVATNDSTQGYSVGSHWLDTTNNKVYVCIDSTATAAIWVEVAEVADIAATYQPLDASLTAYAALVTAANKGLYFTGADTPATFDLTAAGRALLDDATAANQLVTLGLTATATELNALDGITATVTELNYTSGVTSAIQTQLNAKQPLDATLTALGAVSTAADTVIYATGIDTFTTTTLSAFGRTLIDDANGSDGLTTLGVTSFAKTILDDIDAAAVLTTLGATSYIQTLLDDANSTTARTTLGLGTADFPRFAGIEIGHATDTTITRVGVGQLAIEGVNVVTISSTDTLTNKTIDANGTGNSITNLEVADFTAASIVTEAEGLNSSDNDTSVPTTAAVKDYVDTATAGASSFDMPVGSVMDYAGTSAPSKWLFAYGQAVSRTTYADLFTALSTTYGVGDGSTTFNLPDLRGRVTAGKDDMGTVSANRLTNQSGGLDGDTLGDTGGAETHTMTVAEMPAHTHSVPADTGNVGTTASARRGDATTSPFNTASAGSDNAHNNVQPTIILNKIIYTGVA